ncbi:MAG: hypothetical protein AVO35_02330 [Candidatus Aegiribacteria sp. MLS_C]|nr:MAG: hypothetical protein AVO35_02330 [Candidatus Aegiribacteria sp. MLS_C]
MLPRDPSRDELAFLLEGGGSDQDLFAAARDDLHRDIGDVVYMRGLIEISNRCGKNCLYCGLRRDRQGLDRYSMAPEEVFSVLAGGYRLGLRSFLLQSGEMQGIDHLEGVAAVLRWCREELPGTRMVLSLGELPEDGYDMLRASGGERYLLRIEFSSPSLYRRFHPDDALHSHDRRVEALQYLGRSGWQTGTGVLIGIPGQTCGDLADDLLFMRDMDIDMVGMGPYVESPGTPMAGIAGPAPDPETRTVLTLRMTALVRLMTEGVNIAATTALQTLSPDGLERGLMAGANVVMPNLTPAVYRGRYDLYSGKSEVNDSPERIIGELGRRFRSIGRELILEDPGDPPHYRERMMEMERNHG